MKSLLLLLFVALFSCTKDTQKRSNQICWECDLSNIPSGTQNPGKIEICDESEQQPSTYKDSQGNVYGGFTCVKK